LNKKQVVIDLYKQGATYKEICSKIKISKPTVVKIVKECIEQGLLQARNKVKGKQQPLVLELTFSNLEYELYQYIAPKYDLEVDKDMNNMIIKLVNPFNLSYTFIKYPLENLEGEIVQNFAKRILKDVKNVKWSPHIVETLTRTEQEDLLYIGKQSLMYFVEGYSPMYIQGFVKFKRGITRQFVAFYKENVRRSLIVEDNQMDLYGKKLKDTD
jgi:transposase